MALLAFRLPSWKHSWDAKLLTAWREKILLCEEMMGAEEVWCEQQALPDLVVLDWKTLDLRGGGV